MGGMCSKTESASSFAIVAKDPSDLTQDEIEMEETKVTEVDDICTAAADSINSVVNLNNDVVGSVEAVKSIATVLLGAYYVKVDGDFQAHLWQPGEDKDKKLEAAELDEICMAQPVLGAAIATMAASSAALHAALSAAPGFKVLTGKSDRLKCKRPAATDGGGASALRAVVAAVAAYNANLFRLKKVAVECSLEEALDFERALVETLTNLRKRANTLKLKAVVDLGALGKLMGGEKVDRADVIKVDKVVDIAFEALPQKYQTAYEAVFGDDGIIACIEGAIDELMSAQDKVTEAQAAVDGLPTELDAIMPTAEAAGLTMTETIKLPGKMMLNSKAAATAPKVIESFGETLKMVLAQIEEAFAAASDVASANDNDLPTPAVSQAA